MADATVRVFEPNRLIVLARAMGYVRRLSAQDENDWVLINDQAYSAESHQSLVLLCVSGLTEQLVRQAHDVGDARHVLRACVSGDYFKQYELSCRHQVDVHFGPGHTASPWQAPQIEAVRLSEEGVAVGEQEDVVRSLLRRVQAGGPPAPGRVEWIGWEVIEATADHAPEQLGASREMAGTSAECTAQQQESSDNASAVGRLLQGPASAVGSVIEAKSTGGDSASAIPEAPDANRVAVSGFVGGTPLIEVLGVHPTQRNAFFRQLERKRLALGDDCWHEVREPRPNQPRFIYRIDSPKLQSLAARYKQPRSA